MKRITTLIFILLLFPLQAWATDYYVIQDGAGSHDGTAVGDTWRVAEFNALTNEYAGDDTIYFSGTITSEVIPPVSGTSGHNVILDGYETNDTTYMNLSELEDSNTISATDESLGNIVGFQELVDGVSL